MASVSPAHAVLLNKDLLDIILIHLDVATIAGIRHCNRALEAAASPFLFRTLLLSTRKRHLRRLRRVAESEKFARGVRKIVWQTAHYGASAIENDPQGRYDHAIHFMLRLSGRQEDRSTKHTEQQHAATVNRYIRLGRDEVTARTDGNLKPMLLEAFSSMTGLKTVVIKVWSEGGDGMRRFFDLDAILPVNQTMPPPYHTLLSPKSASVKQDQVFLTLLSALSDAGRSLQRFGIESSDNRALGRPDTQHFAVFPGMLIHFDHLSKTTLKHVTQPLRRLHSLHIDLADEDKATSNIVQMYQCIGEGGLARFLATLTSLEHLHVRIHTQCTIAGPFPAVHTVVVPLQKIFGSSVFPRLRRLSLDSLWLEPTELCDLLLRHGATLEQLTLANINLGETGRGRQMTPGITTLLPPGQRFSHFLPTSPLPATEWTQVARTCPELPKLQGLKIEAPSVSMDWCHLAVFDVEELVEMGIDGRDNTLSDGPPLDIWGCLEGSAV
ncbi:hypothetical protein LTR37_002403 [Vermiconidia calcicola]|uniref:Uncharacterized protein n=1 Tax=Vermiconidia calcicola TaxID=1690605 RepID=A0ACC3NSY0_9PEZI|nr:hypothetical protein LTR37_002403 [Vermiconidia calcicola]